MCKIHVPIKIALLRKIAFRYLYTQMHAKSAVDCMTPNMELSFESAYARLEEILEKMNSGKVALEESLKLYEEADRLITWCNKQLSTAERRIEILAKNREGELVMDAQGQPIAQEFITTHNAPLNRNLHE